VERELLSGQREASWFVGEAANIFRESDLAIVNQECVLASTGAPIVKEGPCLKAHPETARLLTHLGITLVTTANNHIRDFGDEGVHKTLETCAAHNIHTVGAGLTLHEARQIYYHPVGGRQLAVINVAEKEFSYATARRAGANPLDLIDLLEDMKEARLHANHLLLIIHGGLEDTHYPSPQSVKLLRFLAEQGATAVVRHHPHYVQGYEVWKGVPIFYSLGNFFFPWVNESVPGRLEGMVLVLRITTNDTCNFKIHGFGQCVDEPRLRKLEGDRDEVFLTKVGKYSNVLRDPAALEREWQALIDELRPDYYGRIALPNYFVLRLFRKLGLLGRVAPSRRKRILYGNWIRCAAHREALLQILNRD
jgi:poly-gamma-glutamate synthesis protein (capsule biosynthesis protein)